MEDFLESRLALPVSATKHLSRKDTRVTECELALSHHRGPGVGGGGTRGGCGPGSPARPQALLPFGGSQVPTVSWRGASVLALSCLKDTGGQGRPVIVGQVRGPHRNLSCRDGLNHLLWSRVGSDVDPTQVRESIWAGRAALWGRGRIPRKPGAQGEVGPANWGRYNSVGPELRDPHGRGVAPRELSAPPQSTSRHPRMVRPPTPRLGQSLAGREENSGIGNVSGFSSPTGLL